MEHTYISIFRNFKSKFPEGKISVLNWLTKDLGHNQIIERIRSCNDKEEQRKLKALLPVATMSGIFEERHSKNLIEHSGLICIDIDGKDNPHISNYDDLKIDMAKLDYVLYAGLSVGGNGLFCLVKISDPENHTAHFRSLINSFKKEDINIDESCSDVCRLRIYSNDKYPYMNLDAKVYDILDTSYSANNKSKQSSKIINKNQQIMKRSNEKTRNLTEKEIQDAFLKPSIPEGYIPIKYETRDDRASRIIRTIVEKQLDITSVYFDWGTICFALANRYPDTGREKFHAVSQFFPKYSRAECDSKYSEILNVSKNRASINRFFEIAARYGIE